MADLVPPERHIHKARSREDTEKLHNTYTAHSLETKTLNTRRDDRNRSEEEMSAKRTGVLVKR